MDVDCCHLQLLLLVLLVGHTVGARMGLPWASTAHRLRSRHQAVVEDTEQGLAWVAIAIAIRAAFLESIVVSMFFQRLRQGVWGLHGCPWATRGQAPGCCCCWGIQCMGLPGVSLGHRRPQRCDYLRLLLLLLTCLYCDRYSEGGDRR